MKNPIKLLALSCSIFCLSVTISNAQETTNSRFGIKGGINFSTLKTNDSEDNNIRTGFNIGLFSKMPLNAMIAIQPELYYSTKGSEVTYNNTFVNGTASFNVNYIEMPILLVLNITKNFNLHAGPYVAVLINGKTTNKSNVELFNFEDNIKVEDFNRVDAGFAAGVGFDLRVLSIGARYNYGMTKVGKERSYAGTTYIFPDAPNKVFSLYASISLK